MATIVADASVAFKWFLDDEEAVAQAQCLLTDVTSTKVKLLLPSLWIYEVTNSFRSAVLKKRISVKDAYAYTNELKTFNFPLVDCSELLNEVITTAFHFSISVYDATYVILAQEKNCPFVTGDKKLYTQINKKLNRIMWVGDYTSKRN